MRRLILGTASVLALGIAGAALDYVVGNNAVNAENMPATSEASQTLPNTAGGDLWKDDIRWAQLELRNRGLYHGSLDGVVGPETKQAVDRFQQSNGLSRTAVLDAQTFDALTGSPGIGQGSSTPPVTQKPSVSGNLGN